MVSPLGSVAAHLVRRAELVVQRVMNYVPEKKRRRPHIFFCENEQYGAFALRHKYEYIVLQFGLILRLTHFSERMMSESWTVAGGPRCCGAERIGGCLHERML